MTTAIMTRSAGYSVRSAQVTKRESTFSLTAFFDIVGQSLAMARAIPDNGRVSAKDIVKARAMAEAL